MPSIVIISESGDHSTSKIIRWIKYHDFHDVMRINIDEEFEVLSINENYAQVNTSFGQQLINKGSVVWFRRSANVKLHLVHKSDRPNDLQFQIDLFKRIERVSIQESFNHWILKKCKSLASPFRSSVDKIGTLIIADKLGLKVPNWIVTCYKSELKIFCSLNKEVVQKTFNHFNYHDDSNNQSYYLYTRKIDMNLEEFSEKFDTSFFQEYIDKSYEIRTFIWFEEIYSMAIFSQNDNSTKVDFRNYNNEKPNRRVPIKLPELYGKKLIELSKSLDLDTCSVDIVVSNEGSYYFLEVNPIGQFGMVSNPCNYMIERKIANDLILRATNEKKSYKEKV